MASQFPRPKRSTIPPKRIVRLGRWVWTTLWRLMMARLAPRDPEGAYIRPESAFRDWITQAPEAVYPPAAQRYRLYVGWGCPWAHRTLVVRAMKGLEGAIALSIVVPSQDGVWIFEKPEGNWLSLPDLYQTAKPGYAGRCTVPVLWDTHTQSIVNNESAEIIEMLNREFNAFAQHPDLDLYPDALKSEIDAWNDRIYHTVNNGVYRCGFAQSQEAYDQAWEELFQTLAAIESTLVQQRYLCGDRPTLADVRLFTTLIRFDLVYYSLFKCNQRRIQDYESLSGYLRDLYQWPGVAETCNLEAIKQDYYGNLFPLNPGGIIPKGPNWEDLKIPHRRDRAYPTIALCDGKDGVD
jgi:putative glutathione S-transferase